MANSIRIKRKTTSSAPLLASLADGEFCVVVPDSALYLRVDGTTLIQVGAGGASATTSTADTGTVISLANNVGNFCNMGAANSNTTFTVTGAVTGGMARVLINTTSQPTVTGGTLEQGASWVTGTDMYLDVYYDGATTKYYFISVASAGGSGATQLSELSDVVSATNTDKFALMANGTTGYVGRAVVKADISDLVLPGAAGTPTEYLSAYNPATGAFTSSQVSYDDLLNVPLSFTPTAHTHTLSEVTDITSTAAELNLLDLSGLTAGWVLSADTATTASWKAPAGGGGGTISGSIADNQIAFGAATADSIEGTANLRYDPAIGGGRFEVNGSASFHTFLEGGYVIIRNDFTGGGYARSLLRFEDTAATALFTIGGYGSGQTLNYSYWGATWTAPAIRVRDQFVDIYGSGTTNPDKPLDVVDGAFQVSTASDITLGGYGGGAKTGTDAYLLAVDSAGKVITSPLIGGSTLVVGDHGTGTVDEVVNVCYGTSATPPTASTTTEGALYIQYTA